MNSPQANMRWLLGYILGHRGAAVGALLSGMVAGISSAASPYLMGVIVDHIRQQVPIEQIGMDALALIGLSIVTVTAFFGQRYFSGQVAYSVNFDIRRTLFDNLLTLDQDFYQHYPTGDLISRMHADTEMVWRLLAIGFTRFGSAAFTVIAAFILLGTINFPLTILVFIVLSVSTTFQLRAGRVLSPVFERVQAQAGTLAALVQDAASGIQTIKTFGKESGAAAKYREENQEYRRRWLYFRRRNEPVGMLPNMISELTAATVVLFGGVMALNGTLTLGNFVQFFVYLSVIGTVLLQLGTIYQRYQQTRGALSRLTPLLQPPRIHSTSDAVPLSAPRGEISIENVGVKVGDSWLLRNVSLRIPAGSVVAVVGPTGCGKTLLVNLLARVFDPTEGRVLIDGVDVRALALEDLRRAIAYVPQSTFLFSQPLHQNVRMGMDNIRDEDFNQAIHISRVSNDLPQLPHGLDTLVGEKGVMLSGGQKQRVAIARAIVRDPAILVLDDALSSVDTHTAADILADLRGVLRTRTSLIIAHRIATVKDADFIVVMFDGRIVEQGAHAELIEQNGLYARMVERELREDEVANHVEA
ncbi:MAG: ABC transporter ATP-binding protein [Chloroflexi bacterium]|nr:ABC transporter ATP-binding protein [Chloroflexota bacterium]